MKKILFLFVLGISSILGASDVVSAYLQGHFQDVESVKSKLNNAGFTVIDSFNINNKGTLTTIIYTNNELKTMANKEKRGFMSTLRVLVDKENNQLSFSNPIYFCEAFMQDENDEKVAKTISSKLKEQFHDLKGSEDYLKLNQISGYHFMFAMPYYDDMEVVAKASSSKELLTKLQIYNSGKNLIFTQKLSDNRILVGIKLSDQTSSFIDKIGTNNSLVLPYPILLENGKALVLAPKYYLAISYPMLKMSQFMTISDVPGKIIEDCKKLFK